MRKIAAILLACWAALAQATVPSETSINAYACNGTQTVYPYTFKIFTDNDLVVTTLTGGVEAILVKTTDYTVSGVGLPAGGNVTLTAGSKCANGATITVKRQIDLKQTTAFRAQGTFSPAVHENALDKLAMGVQQLERDKVALKGVRGSWNIATAYVIGDIVTHDGSSYLALAPSTGVQPPAAGTWSLIAERGLTGLGVNRTYLASTLSTTDAVAYTSIFTAPIPMVAGKVTVFHVVLAQSSAATTTGVQTKVSLSDTANADGTCGFDYWTSAPSRTGQLKNLDTPTENISADWYGGGIPVPTEIMCVVTPVNTTPTNLIVEFQTEVAGSDATTYRGSFYEVITDS